MCGSGVLRDRIMRTVAREAEVLRTASIFDFGRLRAEANRNHEWQLKMR